MNIALVNDIVKILWRNQLSTQNWIYVTRALKKPLRGTIYNCSAFVVLVVFKSDQLKVHKQLYTNNTTITIMKIITIKNFYLLTHTQNKYERKQCNCLHPQRSRKHSECNKHESKVKLIKYRIKAKLSLPKLFTTKEKKSSTACPWASVLYKVFWLLKYQK